jgi:hypothetical protein
VHREPCRELADRGGAFASSAGADGRLRLLEVPDVEPAERRLNTVLDRLRTLGNPAADIDGQPRLARSVAEARLR